MTAAPDIARGSAPPGPHTGRRYAPATDFTRDRLGFLERLVQTHGDVSQFRLAFNTVYMLNHPDHVKQLLVTDAPLVSKSRVIKLGRIILGNGLLSSEGDFHRKQRRLMAPAFQPRRLALYAKAMARHAAALDDAWRAGQQVDMHREMNAVTLHIIAETLFGAGVAREDAEGVNEALETIFSMINRISNPLEGVKNFLPLPSNFRFLAARQRLNRIVRRIIRARERSGEDRDDILTMLLRARDTEGDGKGMRRGQVRDEVLILFLAGHETTANLLTWTWYLLARHLEAEARLHAELDAVLGGAAPGLDDLPRLPYTRQVLEESLRLYPPAYVIDRQTQAPLEVGGYHIPRGYTVFVSPWCIHRDPRFYPDPERFDPMRWTPEEKAKRPKYAYFPFGAGPRVCIGEHFAWLEATIVLATLAQGWRPRLAPGYAPAPFPQVTLRPRDGLPMTLEARPS